MSPFRRVFILSDLHLESATGPLFTAVLQTLDQANRSGDAVVLAGDIFEILVGGSAYFARKFSLLFEKLETLIRRGVVVFYIEGNHDFHVQSVLPKGVILADPDLRIPLQESEGGILTLYVAHGDLIDLEDVAYLRMRRVFRSPLFRFLAGALPGRWLEWIAARISRASNQKALELPEHWPAGRRARLRSVFRGFAEARRREGVDLVALGHCHDLDEYGGFYWNMGYPPVHRQFLVYDCESARVKDRLERRNLLGF